MQFTILDILTVLGALGLFIFGMKKMSEGLQKVAGARMRNILAAITSNKYKSLLTGLTITLLIQSSSASTVMVVSFVNAGLLSLTESIGIILGANIGTTITAWIIAGLGLSLKISTLALPIIGLSFILLLSRRNRNQNIAELVIGFALIFLGLDFLKSTIPDVSKNPEILEFLANYIHYGFLSKMLFFFIGLLVTAIIQSSSVSSALTIVMCYNGWITYEFAAAMIVGENIGTTITANIAAIVGNSVSKYAARAHFIVNVIGAVGVFLVFNIFLDVVDWITQILTNKSAYTDVSAIPIALALFHTLFNVVNVLILINFIPLIINLSKRLVIKRQETNEFKLKYISGGILSTSELSLVQARREVVGFGKRVYKMFGLVKKLFAETNDIEFQNLYETISSYENYSDQIEIEIANYLTKASEGELSMPASRRISLMLRLVDSLESVADSCNSISKTLRRKKKNKIWFTQDLRDNINDMFALVTESLSVMLDNLNGDYDNFDSERAMEIEKSINKKRKNLSKEHINNIEQKNYTYQAGIIYTDIVSQCEILGNEIYNITKTLIDYKENITNRA